MIVGAALATPGVGLLGAPVHARGTNVDQLNIQHVRNALGKLGCRTRTQAATRAIELGLVATTAAR